MVTTTTKTYSIELDMFNKFDELCKQKKFNKSKIIQECIKTFVIDNFEIENKRFLIRNSFGKTSKSEVPIRVLEKNNGMFHLSDGNILNFETFDLIYEETEIPKIISETMPYNNFNIDEINEINEQEIVDEDFLNCNFDQKIVDKFVEEIKTEPRTLAVELTEQYYHNVLSDERKLKIIKDLNSLNLNKMINVTDLFGLIELEIFVQKYEIIIFYNKNTCTFDRLKFIKLIQSIINGVTDIINIKIIPHEGEKFNITDEDLLITKYDDVSGNFNEEFIERIEEFIKRKFGVSNFTITHLQSMMTGKYSFLIETETLLLKELSFHETLDKHFHNDEISFDLGRITNAQLEIPMSDKLKHNK